MKLPPFRLSQQTSEKYKQDEQKNGKPQTQDAFFSEAPGSRGRGFISCHLSEKFTGTVKVVRGDHDLYAKDSAYGIDIPASALLCGINSIFRKKSQHTVRVLAACRVSGPDPVFRV